MWGNIITDLSYQTNYWFSFPSSNSDVIISLTMWQYWWWFWFTYYITVYFFLFSRIIRHRLLKFSPKMTTSQKSHGKWGDFLICVVPIAWCVNILSNSNFILRMIEWQTESSLFTIRVRGRQWYWVYKIELKDLLRVTQNTKNLGHNYWELFANTSGEEGLAAANLQQLRRYNEEYLAALKSRLVTNPGINGTYVSSAAGDVSATHSGFNPNKRTLRAHNYALLPALDLVDTSKGLEPRWEVNPNKAVYRDTPDNLYFVLKQKRFAPIVQKASSIRTKDVHEHFNLSNAERLVIKSQHSYASRWAAKRLKYKAADIANVYNRRMLRTKRVLVLPVGVNITVITNSFDVVHSWYIPGLGLKLDCIPGRSTHHTLFIDHAGFYYGQCAEICGRYHHHMPIRICALPFEHYMIWWYHYGLPYFNSFNGARKESIRGGIRQYAW